jgi:uncharacterized membrane protein
MNRFLKLGRLFFAVPLVVFGIQYFLYGHYSGGLPPVPPWTPGGAIGAYLIGAFLLAAGISLTVNWNDRLFAVLLGVVFLLCVVFLQCQRLSAVIHDGTSRTRALEPLALAGAAFVLAALSPVSAMLSSWDGFIAKLSTAGRLVFAFTLVIFGLQHFLYAAFIATLIPSWIPARLFFAYFTGIGFIAAGVSIAINIYARLASILLGVMMLSWVVFLHAPRVAAHLRNGDEWTSAFVALAMSGAGFILAASFSRKS